MRRMFEIAIAAVVWLAVFALGAALASGALAASSPSVVTEGATNLGQSSAVLNGTVNPNGSGATYYFQWGLTKGYGVDGAEASAGSGTKALSVHQTARGLLPGTTYHYRLVADNRYGVSMGADRTFTTTGHPPPDVGTGPATGISQNGATLTGVVNPRGAATSWTFQYGPNPAYGYQTFAETTAPGSSALVVAYPLQALAPGTIYHYRLVASHSGGVTSYGADGTFMTYPTQRPVPSIQATTAPRRLRHKPYSVLTLGRIRGPGSIPDAYACSGNVEIRYLRGQRQVAATFVPLHPDCSFGGGITFAHTHRPLSVRVRFLGNGYLAPNHARPTRIRFT